MDVHVPVRTVFGDPALPHHVLTHQPHAPSPSKTVAPCAFPGAVERALQGRMRREPELEAHWEGGGGEVDLMGWRDNERHCRHAADLALHEIDEALACGAAVVSAVSYMAHQRIVFCPCTATAAAAEHLILALASNVRPREQGLQGAFNKNWARNTGITLVATVGIMSYVWNLSRQLEEK